MRMRRQIARCLAGIGVCGLLTGSGMLVACSARQIKQTTALPAAEGPLGPAAIRIYPLTHIDAGADGKPVIVCHVELRDRFGDSVKGLGVVEMQLLRAPSPLPQQSWEIDLGELSKNAELYDRSTRTYRFQLGDLPAWMTPKGEGLGTLRLRATYTPLGGQHDASAMSAYRDEYQLSK
jgi:hypothetical protein